MHTFLSSLPPPSGSRALSGTPGAEPSDISRITSPNGARPDHGPIGSGFGLQHRRSLTFAKPNTEYSLTSNIANLNSSNNVRANPWNDAGAASYNMLGPGSISQISTSGPAAGVGALANSGPSVVRRASAFGILGVPSYERRMSATGNPITTGSSAITDNGASSVAAPVNSGIVNDIWSFGNSSKVLSSPNSNQLSHNNNLVSSDKVTANISVSGPLQNTSPHLTQSPDPSSSSPPPALENDKHQETHPTQPFTSLYSPNSKSDMHAIDPKQMANWAAPANQDTLMPMPMIQSSGSPRSPVNNLQRNYRSVSFSHNDSRYLSHDSIRDHIPPLAAFAEDPSLAIQRPNQFQPDSRKEFVDAFNQLSTNEKASYNFNSQSVSGPSGQPLNSVISGIWDPSVRRHSLATASDHMRYQPLTNNQQRQHQEPLVQKTPSAAPNGQQKQSFSGQPSVSSNPHSSTPSPPTSNTTTASNNQVVATNGSPNAYAPQPHSTQTQPHNTGNMTNNSSMSQTQTQPSNVATPAISGVLDPAIDAYFSDDRLMRNGGYDFSDMTFEPPCTQRALSSLINLTGSRLYLVQFKGGRVDVFHIPDNSTFEVHYGDLVIVDADRGRDLGKVIRENLTPEEAGWIKWRQFSDQQAALQQTPSEPGSPTDREHDNVKDDKAKSKKEENVDSNEDDLSKLSPDNITIVSPKQILRYAQFNEIQQIMMKELDEEKAVKMCSSKVIEKALKMRVVDAEYQWDRRKLTFFYSANHRIDFRELVRDLFRIYKTRIWMCATHSPYSQEFDGDGSYIDNAAQTGNRYNTVTSTAATSAAASMAPGTVISSNYGFIGGSSPSNTGNSAAPGHYQQQQQRRSSNPNSPTRNGHHHNANYNGNLNRPNGRNNTGYRNASNNIRRPNYYNGGEDGFQMNPNRHASTGSNGRNQVSAAALVNGVQFTPSANSFGQYAGNNFNTVPPQQIMNQQQPNNGWRYQHPQQLDTHSQPTHNSQNYNFFNGPIPQDNQYMMNPENMYRGVNGGVVPNGYGINTGGDAMPMGNFQPSSYPQPSSGNVGQNVNVDI